MADVSVDATISTATARGGRCLVFPTSDVGYVFYIDSDGVFGYAKTTDGGGTWGAQVNVDSLAATTVVAFDIWFDQWTPGDSGTLIHCWWFDSTNDDITYRTLNISGDALGTQRTVDVRSSVVAGRGVFISGTKTRSGYLYCAYDIDAGAEKGLFRSTDGGTTWGSNLSTSFVEASLDTCKLFPASGTGDDNDCWALYYDASATALTIKLWDSSAGSAVESSTFQTHTDGATDLTGQFGYDGTIRHSDGHLLVAAVSLRDNVSSNHQVFDVTSTASIATLTNITTGIDDHYYPQIFINQGTGTIFVAYNGKRDGSEAMDSATKVYYTYSTNGGTSWNAGDAAYMEGAAGNVLQVWTPITGQRFYCIWRVAGTLVGNKVNSLIQLIVQGPTPIVAVSVLHEPTVVPGAVLVAADTIVSAAQVTVPTIVSIALVITETIASTAHVDVPTLAAMVMVPVIAQPSALARVQATPSVTASSAASVTASFLVPPTVGNAVAVAVTSSTTVPPTSCVDNHGNSYTLARSHASASSGARVDIYVCAAVTTTGTPFTITVTE